MVEHWEHRLKDEYLLFWLALLLPPFSLLWFPGHRYVNFAVIALVVSLVTLARHCLSRPKDSSASPEANGVFSNCPDRRLLARFRLHLRRAVNGEAGFGWYTILLVLGVGVAFFAWFADGVKEQEPFLAAGAFFYAVGLISSADLLFNRLVEAAGTKRTILVSWASETVFRSDKGPIEVLPESVQDKLLAKYKTEEEVRKALIDNKLEVDEITLDKPNFFPVLAVVANDRYRTLEHLDLIPVLGTEKGKYVDFYWQLLEQMAQALNPKLEVKHDETIEKPGYDVIGLRDELQKRYGKRLRENSGSFVFSITSGTSAMSAAMILVALKGSAEGVYIDQAKTIDSSGNKVPLWKRVVPIRLTVYDIADLFGEEEDV